MRTTNMILLVFILATIVLTACSSSEKNYDYVPVEGGSCDVQGNTIANANTEEIVVIDSLNQIIEPEIQAFS